jgi:hypothetical protein
MIQTFLFCGGLPPAADAAGAKRMSVVTHHALPRSRHLLQRTSHLALHHGGRFGRMNAACRTANSSNDSMPFAFEHMFIASIRIWFL